MNGKGFLLCKFLCNRSAFVLIKVNRFLPHIRQVNDQDVVSLVAKHRQIQSVIGSWRFRADDLSDFILAAFFVHCPVLAIRKIQDGRDDCFFFGQGAFIDPADTFRVGIFA